MGLCYQLDLAAGFFGAHEAPLLFTLGGIVAAFVTAFGYGWVLYPESGRHFLARFGLE